MLIEIKAMTQASEVWPIRLEGLWCLHSPGALSETYRRAGIRCCKCVLLTVTALLLSFRLDSLWSDAPGKRLFGESVTL